MVSGSCREHRVRRRTIFERETTGIRSGSNTTPRSNLLAYDITTGNLVTSFAPTVNGTILNMAKSPDGTRLYIVGDFTSVNGSVRNRVAAFNLPGGTLAPGFTPNIGSRVKAVVATNDTVWLGGNHHGRRCDSSRSPSGGSRVGWRHARLEPRRRLQRQRTCIDRRWEGNCRRRI